MKTKVVIIDIDLGVSVNDIIADDVAAIAGAAQQELDTAIDLAKSTKKLKEEKEAASTAASDKIVEAMETAYQTLEKAGAIGVPTDTISEIINDAIPNLSAFALRMKKVLASKDHPYTMNRIKHLGASHYVFTPFNNQPST